MRRYLVLAALITGIAILAAIGLNWAIDPYGVFATRDVDGFNTVKPRAGQRGWLAKVYRIQHMRPRALVLGNSRAEVGLDPEHPDWPARVRPVVNAGIPGTGPSTARDLLSLALRLQKPELVLLGVDFLDFRTAPDASTDTPPAAPDPLTGSARLRDYRDILFSISALRDSFATLIAQRDPYARDLTRLGFNPMRDHVEIAHSEGYKSLFAQKDLDNARNYVNGPKSIFVSGTRTSDALASLREIVRMANGQGIDLRIVIYPYHARILELFHATGLWPAFEDWKRAIVEIVEQERSSRRGSRISIWDFSGYSERTAEAVPDGRGQNVDMQWYWEAGHFKKAFGDRILHQVLTGDDNGDGVRLESENIEKELDRIRLSRHEYLQLHAQEAAAMRQLAARSAPSRQSAKRNP